VRVRRFGLGQRDLVGGGEEFRAAQSAERKRKRRARGSLVSGMEVGC
jgi:hypothetical protein